MSVLQQIPRVPTGNVGFDHMLRGGLPAGRSTLVTGSAGSGKTIFALQFLIDGARQFDDPAVFVTFEESPALIRANAASLGFDIATSEEQGLFSFVDVGYDPSLDEQVVGSFDFLGLMARIEHAVRELGAKRVVLDSVGAVFDRYEERGHVRRELARVTEGLRELGVTSMITAERTSQYGNIARFGVEEFVCDNVVVLRNVLQEESRRRTLELVKMRGIDHETGEVPFTIVPGEGISVITLAGGDLTAKSTTTRITSGLAELDKMCAGGMFRDSLTLISGATGTGKTLLVTEFIDGGIANGERSLILGFEESRDQLFRNADGWGRDFAAYEREGVLKVHCTYPEVRSLEAHLIAIKRAVEEFQPTRLAIDSLSALERLSPERSFREFLISLTSYMKHNQIAAVFTATARNLLGGPSVTEAHISTLTDMIVLLRYVEIAGEIRRGLTVLKLRGSTHEKRIREYTISNSGMAIGAPFRDVTGILTGSPQTTVNRALEDVAEMFDDDLI